MCFLLFLLLITCLVIVILHTYSKGHSHHSYKIDRLSEHLTYFRLGGRVALFFLSRVPPNISVSSMVKSSLCVCSCFLLKPIPTKKSLPKKCQRKNLSTRKSGQGYCKGVSKYKYYDDMNTNAFSFIFFTSIC